MLGVFLGFLDPCLPIGFLVSWILGGFLVSWFLAGFLASWFLGLLVVSWFLGGFLVSWFLGGFVVSWFLAGFLVSWWLGVYWACIQGDGANSQFGLVTPQCGLAAQARRACRRAGSQRGLATQTPRVDSRRARKTGSQRQLPQQARSARLQCGCLLRRGKRFFLDIVLDHPDHRRLSGAKQLTLHYAYVL